MHIAHIGALSAHRERYVARLRTLGDVTLADSLDSALRRNWDAPPRVTIILRPHADAIDLASLTRWRIRFPLTRCVTLLGPWLAGRARDADIWRTMAEFPWYQMDAFFALLQRYARGLTDRTEECSLPSSLSPFASKTPTVWLATHDRSLYAALADVFHGHAWHVISDATSPAELVGNVRRQRVDERITLGLFDQPVDSRWHATTAWSRCDQRWGLCPFPRIRDYQHCLQLGYHGIAAQPIPRSIWARWLSSPLTRPTIPYGPAIGLPHDSAARSGHKILGGEPGDDTSRPVMR